MPIPYYSPSRRKHHYWKIRRNGYRELLLLKGWGMRGAYASKFIRGEEVMLTIARKTDDHYLCCFQLKSNFWSLITTRAREDEAKERRATFQLVKGKEPAKRSKLKTASNPSYKTVVPDDIQ